jgi:hypothetical protein
MSDRCVSINTRYSSKTWIRFSWPRSRRTVRYVIRAIQSAAGPLTSNPFSLAICRKYAPKPMVSSRSGLLTSIHVPLISICCPTNHADVWKEILKKKDPATYMKYQSRFEDDRKASSKAPEPRWRKVYLVSFRFGPLYIYATSLPSDTERIYLMWLTESLGERSDSASQRR